MFSVIRFTALKGRSTLESLGADINDICPGLYSGTDKVPNRFSCSLSEEKTWPAQYTAIKNKLLQLLSVLRRARAIGVKMELDIAVYNEDYESRLITELHFENKFTQFLHENSIELTISIYGGQEIDI